MATVLALGLPATASATVMINTIEGRNDRPNDVTNIDLGSTDCGGYAACGGDFGIYNDTVEGLRANPHGGKSDADYLAVPELDNEDAATDSNNDIPGGTSWFSVSESGDRTANYFSLLWGSVDTFNTLHFSRDNDLVASIGGEQILDWFVDDPDKQGRDLHLEFEFLREDRFDTIWFESDRPAFESAYHAFRLDPVPEGDFSGAMTTQNSTEDGQTGEESGHEIDSDGYAIDSDRGIVYSVPLPSSLALILAGLIGACVTRLGRPGRRAPAAPC